MDPFPAKLSLHVPHSAHAYDLQELRPGGGPLEERTMCNSLRRALGKPAGVGWFRRRFAYPPGLLSGKVIRIFA